MACSKHGSKGLVRDSEGNEFCGDCLKEDVQLVEKVKSKMRWDVISALIIFILVVLALLYGGQQ